MSNKIYSDKFYEDLEKSINKYDTPRLPSIHSFDKIEMLPFEPVTDAIREEIKKNMSDQEKIVEQIKAECVKLAEEHIYKFDDEQNRYDIVENYQRYLDYLVQACPGECMRLVSENGGGDCITCQLDFGNGDTRIIKSKLPSYAYPLSDNTVNRVVIDIKVTGTGENIND